MLKKRLITTMLWNGNTLVKGNNFINSRRAGSPITTIRIYNSRDVDEILFLNITKSTSREKFDYNFIRQLTDECYVPITIGGGVKKIYEITDLLFAGADKILINTEAYNNLNLINEAAKKFGSQTIVLGIDYKKLNKKNVCYSHSGKKNQKIDPLSWAKKCVDYGAGEIILTSIDHDGLMQGYDLEFLNKFTNEIKVPVVVSGGAGNYDHFLEAFNNGASAAAAASIYHFTEKTPNEAKRFLLEKNISVRKNFD